MERSDISKLNAQAKIAGTFVDLGGAVPSTLYKGILVISPHRRHGNRTDGISKVFLDGNWIKGCLVLFISNLSLAAFFFLQVIDLIIKMFFFFKFWIETKPFQM